MRNRGIMLQFDHHKAYCPLPKMDVHHLALSPSQIGACSLHEFQRNSALKGQTTTPTPQGEGFMAALVLTETSGHRSWINGREIAVRPALAGQFRFFDLRNSFIAELPPAFHTVHLFMPNAALSKRAGGSPKWDWEEDSFYDDPILSHLVRAMIPAIRNPSFQDQLFCDLILQAASRHVAGKYADLIFVKPLSARNLSRKEESQAKGILLDRIGGNVSLDEVASACGVSTDHFGKMFKWSTGLPPYRWLTLQRIERAKLLLRSSNDSLVEIALECGFANQSHFTRVFSREVGLSPGRWRRQGGA
jgi:AraC family transcriptional regulator